MLHRGIRDVVMKGRFSHARLWQLIGIAVMACVALLCFGIYIPALRTIQGALLVLFFSLHVRFFRFLLQEKGIWFLVRAVPFSCLDALVMAAGASSSSSSSPESSMRSKKLVGGNCFGSPTTTNCDPRAMAPSDSSGRS